MPPKTNPSIIRSKPVADKDGASALRYMHNARFHNYESKTIYYHYKTPIFIKDVQELYNKSHVAIENEVAKFLEKVIAHFTGDTSTWDNFMTSNDWLGPLCEYQKP